MKLNEYIEITNEDNMELMKLYPDKFFDLAIVDPPYGLKQNGGKTGGAGFLKNRVFNSGAIEKWDTMPPKRYFDELFRISKNQIIWGGNYFALPANRCFVVWDKCQPFPNFSACEYAWTSFTDPAKIFKFDNRISGKIHPTQKPIELYTFLLQTFAKKGDKIIDTHFGSGSIACAVHEANIIDKMDLSLVACELDKDYFESSIQRVKEALQTQSLF